MELKIGFASSRRKRIDRGTTKDYNSSFKAAGCGHVCVYLLLSLMIGRGLKARLKR